MKNTHKKTTSKLNTPTQGSKNTRSHQASAQKEVKNPWQDAYWLYYLPDLNDTIFAHIGEYVMEQDGYLPFSMPGLSCEDGAQPCWAVEQFNHVLRVDDYHEAGMPRFPEGLILLVMGKPVTRLSVRQSGPNAFNVVAQDLYPLAEDAVPNDLLPWKDIIKGVAS